MNLARIKSFRELPPPNRPNVFSAVSEIAITYAERAAFPFAAPPLYFEEKKCGFA